MLRPRIAAAIRVRGYSIRTEKTYIHWIARFLHFHGEGAPETLSGAAVPSFLEHLAVRRKVAAATQNQALNALALLCDMVLGTPLGDVGGFAHAKARRRLPTVLTHSKIQRLLACLGGAGRLIAALLYGTGMRLMECLLDLGLGLDLDLDFAYGQINVRHGKGGKDRVVPLPEPLAPLLAEHRQRVRRRFEEDCAAGHGEVYLPEALARKFPNAPSEWRWHWVFPGEPAVSGPARRGPQTPPHP